MCVCNCVFDSVSACVDLYKRNILSCALHNFVLVYGRMLFCVYARLTHTRGHISSRARWWCIFMMYEVGGRGSLCVVIMWTGLLTPDKYCLIAWGADCLPVCVRRLCVFVSVFRLWLYSRRVCMLRWGVCKLSLQYWLIARVSVYVYWYRAGSGVRFVLVCMASMNRAALVCVDVLAFVRVRAMSVFHPSKRRFRERKMYMDIDAFWVTELSPMRLRDLPVGVRNRVLMFSVMCVYVCLLNCT